MLAMHVQPVVVEYAILLLQPGNWVIPCGLCTNERSVRKSGVTPPLNQNVCWTCVKYARRYLRLIMSMCVHCQVNVRKGIRAVIREDLRISILENVCLQRRGMKHMLFCVLEIYFENIVFLVKHRARLTCDTIYIKSGPQEDNRRKYASTVKWNPVSCFLFAISAVCSWHVNRNKVKWIG